MNKKKFSLLLTIIGIFQSIFIEILAQDYKVIYAQLSQTSIDTTIYELPAFSPKLDTLAKWSLAYACNKSLIKQTQDSPAERKTYYVNKQTGNFDSHTTHNMGKNDVTYIDYDNQLIRKVTYFFDKKHVIEDNLPIYEWTHYSDEKMIESFLCKRATTREPIGGLYYDVWYTEAIPVSAGPLGLYGLPGMILEVKRNGVPFYTAIDIKELADSVDVVIEKPEPHAESISLSDYHKVRMGVPFKNKNVQPPNRQNNKHN